MKLSGAAGQIELTIETKDPGKTFRVTQPGWHEGLEGLEVREVDLAEPPAPFWVQPQEAPLGPSTFTIGANALLPVGNRPQGWPQECIEERCSYFVHYLRHSRPGERDMPHAAYHVAEKQCLEAQERLQELENQGKDTPSMVNHILKLEREVRA